MTNCLSKLVIVVLVLTCTTAWCGTSEYVIQRYPLGARRQARILKKRDGKVESDVRFRSTMTFRDGPRVDWVGSEENLLDGSVEPLEFAHWPTERTQVGELGLRRDSQVDQKLTIDGVEIPVRMSRWTIDRKQVDVEQLRKLFIEPPDLDKLPRMSATVVVYEARGSDVEIPEHRFPANGWLLAIGRQTLKVLFDSRFMDADGKLIEHHQGEETVVGLKETVRVGQRGIRCVKTQQNFSVLIDDATQSLDSEYQRTVWLSTQVPGYRVKDIAKYRDGDETTETIEALEDFSFPSRQPRKATDPLPELDKRPQIPGNKWAGLHAGGWYTEVEVWLPRDPDSDESGSVYHTLIQVRDVVDGNLLAVTEQQWGDDQWEESSELRILDLSQQPVVSTDKGTASVIKILGKETACLRQRDAKRLHDHWYPQSDRWKKIMNKLPVSHVREEYRQIDEDDPYHFITELSSLEETLRIGGRDVECVEYSGKGWDGEKREKPAHRFLHYYATDVPTRHHGQPTIEVDVDEDGVGILMLLDFGEAERPVPDAKQLRALVDEFSKSFRPRFTEFLKEE